MDKNLEKEKKQISHGASFCEILTAILIGLKLAGLIKISWLWVLAPIWIPIVLIIIVGVIAGIISHVIYKDDDWSDL